MTIMKIALGVMGAVRETMTVQLAANVTELGLSLLKKNLMIAMTTMNNQELASNMAKDLFDVVKKYSAQMSASQIVGILEMHKQELIWHHFNEVKNEMIWGQK